MQTKAIVYFGSDDSFYIELRQALENTLKNFTLETRLHLSGAVLTYAEELCPNLLFLDEPCEFPFIAEELSLLKKNAKYKSVTICVLCKNKTEVSLNAHLLTLGVQLFFIKGGDLDLFLKNCYYLAFNEKIKIPRFATAKDLKIQLPLGICSTLNQISTDSLLIETDVSFGADQLTLIRPPFSDHSNLPFTVKTHLTGGTDFVTFESYELTFPYAGPWDSVSSDSISRDTIETWISYYRDRCNKTDSILTVFSGDSSLAQEWLTAPLKFSNVDFHWHLPQNLETYLKFKKPSVLAFDLGELNTLEALSDLVSTIGSIDYYQPIVVVTNSPSSAEALKKICPYRKLLAACAPLTGETLLLLSEKLAPKVQAMSEGCLALKLSDKNRAVSILAHVRLTSLSEHIVTFGSELELPFFSTVELTLPIPMLVTIVPPFSLLRPQTSGNWHYQGIIHGLDEDELKRLRKIINQLIYKPVEVITSESVTQMLNQNFVETPVVKAAEVSYETDATVIDQPEALGADGGRFVAQRKNILGKRSKL
ncbi:MAG TPA: hypothetical protein VNJ01_13185 [Bacteriovoracaceae bacterium]|nr:hypothetical protein [Bacteriovoracaceae bacterium]